jgi:beta-glucosidase
VALMRSLNLNSYRFSVAWTRIQADGVGKPNSKGLDFYSRLVDELLAANIRPMLTLYHWDLPQKLEDAGGWTNRDLASRFADYAEIVSRALGDRVQDWLLLNEPAAFLSLGYLEGTHAPGRRSIIDFLKGTHVANLAQGAGFRAIKAICPKSRVGSAFSMSPCEPVTNSEEDKQAAERAHGMVNVWFLEPALRGRYPNAFSFSPAVFMKIQQHDMDLVRAPLDFIGMNLYYRVMVSAPTLSERLSDARLMLLPARMSGGQKGPKTDKGWEVWPQSMYEMVMRITRDYGRPVLEITENGCAYNDGPFVESKIAENKFAEKKTAAKENNERKVEEKKINDARRVAYHQSYLSELARAIRDGADVRGYHAWSLMDNFEWAEGFSQRFGLTYVDYQTQKRTIKASGAWYANSEFRS